METELRGKGVLVTGGAGGIGSATVRAFAEEGARVAVHYRSNEDKARALATEVGGAAVRADLTSEAEVDALIPEAVKALGRLDVVVANAGHWPSQDEPVWKMSLTRWRQTLAENLDSVFLTCRAFLRHVETTKVGSLVLVSSTAGLFGEAGHSDYAAAKGALASGFVKSLKNELGRIAPMARVNVVCPGWTEVDRNRGKLQDPAFLARVTRTMALRKVGRPEDIARVIVTLASDRISGHVTGEVVTVAGGMEGRVLHDT
ncbi:SDR family NAD(P)-dependent oxidoreductase [Hyalangium minutum]|uniref:3-oxoacyl-[acyl-carrier protein] reductase n=1 Tax=Hyalangium minutum TaxID=394096 RepID=A0A085WP11_9BACT|nr:SDR family NAD(P)-dependent oxidoreductase [Hyalangium minutum]KFE69424.1 3-oxoacyl-[acyl-carrier protein] reductase [Hyalangium minutum]